MSCSRCPAFRRLYQQAFALVRVGGRVQMLGIPAKPMEVDFATEIIFKGITVYGVVGRRM
jgi:threonine 3-dehydrogenase